jgi:hypothetical protein
MSIWYEVAGVLILKETVWPTLALIEVANPWIVESPMPVTCQSLGGSPGNAFSQATGFPHAATASVANAKLAKMATPRAAAMMITGLQRRRSDVQPDAGDDPITQTTAGDAKTFAVAAIRSTRPAGAARNGAPPTCRPTSPASRFARPRSSSRPHDGVHGPAGPPLTGGQVGGGTIAWPVAETVRLAACRGAIDKMLSMWPARCSFGIPATGADTSVSAHRVPRSGASW